jgi:hypothetical protein
MAAPFFAYPQHGTGDPFRVVNHLTEGPALLAHEPLAERVFFVPFDADNFSISHFKQDAATGMTSGFKTTAFYNGRTHGGSPLRNLKNYNKRVWLQQTSAYRRALL